MLASSPSSTRRCSGGEFDDYSDRVDVLPPEGEPGEFALACQTVPDFRAPTWPDCPVLAQAHLDLYVDSIADSEPAVLAAGARRHAVRSRTPDGAHRKRSSDVPGLLPRLVGADERLPPLPPGAA
ncbi:hypothetical protein [Rhodococcus sp. IEGM 1408]|uniref:hypothetical protein n=1 Tax=Rhodococcus sp. IEGM 1408 TaxID=3082220 RepID=UPI00295511DB|nr:hypothetical protein [Rhodococcus sp. IEGM 1408]